MKGKYFLLEAKEANSQEKISDLEKNLKDEIEARRIAQAEKESLEKMIIEQQKVMKLALARILPRKGELKFCQVII